ncbi:hypothetical protein S245_050952, partial [Arachis hypogaea]
VLYFHRLKHGPLHACRVPEPWIVEWITNELDQKANYVISQGCIVNNARNRRRKNKHSSSEAGVRCLARTLTNLRLSNARLHLSQDIRSQI